MSSAHYFDISAARRDFGYVPTITIEEGLRRLEAWIAKSGLVATGEGVRA
jgi:nucleoside-diphosphate-sugar epimerase